MSKWLAVPVAALALALVGADNGCPGGEGEGGSIPATKMDYVVFAWNDLGMHCANPRYDEAVILPPYNTLWAQVVRRNAAPEIITEGITVEYRFINNTYSYGKTDGFDADFAQFWDYAEDLFGVALEPDTGLNLEDPDLHNGLEGTMVLDGDHFKVVGVPLVPVNDAGAWDPYQVAEITVRDAQGQVIAQTRATAPISDEIDCVTCHGQGGVATAAINGGTESPYNNILAVHDYYNGTHLVDQKPVLCASCHGSPALGATGTGSAGMYLSEAIHGRHADQGATCYNCHPGEETKCSRSKAHTAADGNCTTCHGTMAQVAGSISQGRMPWVEEPKCVDCHTGVAGVDTGDTLYRNATGHGTLNCATCHGSPHAMYPSTLSTDNYQPQQYQDASLTIGSCGVCHSNSRGEGSEEFAQQHGGVTSVATACNVCHTTVSSNTTAWPHSYTWKAH